MQTVKVNREEEFSDRKVYLESLLKTEKIAFNILDLEPWQALPMRRHRRSDTILLAVQGDGTMFMDRGEFSLEEGEAVYVPAGASYGILAGENDMVVVASQGPTPIDTESVEGLEYRCPACGLETPVAIETPDGAGTTCPRCNARLKLDREAAGFRAREVRPPQFTGAAPGAGGTLQAGQAQPGRQAMKAGEEKEFDISRERKTEAAGTTGKSKETEAAGTTREGSARLAGTAEPSQARPEARETQASGEAGPARIAFSAYEFEPWQVVPMHTNPGSDTILYFAKGQGIMLIDDESRSVDDETAVYVPAGAMYGIIAGDNDLVVVSMQCPVPVEAEVFGDLGYNCPVCDLGVPVTTDTYTGCVTVCPRCNVKLKLTRQDGGFEAEETSEPAPASAETM